LTYIDRLLLAKLSTLSTEISFQTFQLRHFAIAPDRGGGRDIDGQVDDDPVDAAAERAVKSGQVLPQRDKRKVS